METADPITAALRRHFQRALAMWREEVENVPETEWACGDVDYLIPARHLCHAVETCDFYIGDEPVDRYDWGRLFGCDWEGAAPNELPARDVALETLDEVGALVDQRLAALGDAGLLAGEERCPWTGPAVLDRMLYLLRHLQHHLGEMHAELRRRSIPRAGWR